MRAVVRGSSQNEIIAAARKLAGDPQAKVKILSWDPDRSALSRVKIWYTPQEKN